MSTVGDVMTRSVVTLRPESSLIQARDLMQTHNIARIVVVDEDYRPKGIVTQKDVIRVALADSTQRDLKEISVSEAMTSELIVVKPETSISECAKILVEHGISSLIIVDADGKLQGIITKSDLCRHFGEAFRGLFKVKDAMTTDVITVGPTHSIFKVINLMNENNVNRIVVTRDNVPTGIVTTSDITLASAVLNPLKVLHREPLAILLTPKKGIIVKPTLGTVMFLTARDLMTSKLITVNAEDDLGSAARIMTDRHISGLPVVGDAGELVGIVTKTDVVKTLSNAPPT
ncbi:MAG: CBS domain-containing protein [Candidatus Geothermarchaeales archaeon]